MIKHSRNPAIAYHQGFKAGLAENIEYAYYADEIINELAYYNVIEEYVKTPKTQVALFKALVAERRRVKDEFILDEDNIAIAIRDVNKVREKYKEPLINWKK